jgi:hypothetical protein
MTKDYNYLAIKDTEVRASAEISPRETDVHPPSRQLLMITINGLRCTI